MRLGRHTSVTPGLLLRIRGEFLEMPGMRLTLRQAMRLWQPRRADLRRRRCALWSSDGSSAAPRRARSGAEPMDD